MVGPLGLMVGTPVLEPHPSGSVAAMFEQGPRNRRPLAGTLLACLAVGLLPSCGDTDEAIFVVLNFDEAMVPTQVDSICLGLWDSDASGGQFGQRYKLESPEATTLAVDPGSASGGRLLLHGFSFGQRVALHQQDFDFQGSEVQASLAFCGPGRAAAATERDRVTIAADSAMAVSQGPEGAWIVVVGPNDSQVFAAGTGGLELLSIAAPSPASGAQALIAIDVDDDCDDDLLLLESGGASLWRRDRGALVAANDLLPPQSSSATHAIALDYNGDLLGDVALVGAEGLTLWQGSSQGLTQVTSGVASAALSNASSVAAGDLDGDGFVDLAIARSGLADRLLYGDGTGTFVVEAAALAEDDRESRAIGIADLDGDGIAEIVVASSGAPIAAFARNEPRRYVDRSFLLLPNADSLDATDVATADWNGDCEPDLLIAAGQAMSWTSGQGALSEESEFAPAREVIIDDLLGQGDRDALLLSATELSWWRR